MEAMVVKTEDWSDRRVLVTGHTGFKGAWLSLWLQKMGAKVVGYALDPPTQPNMFEIAGVRKGMESVTGDVRDYENLFRVMSRFKPEVVFHLAAQSLVRESYRSPRVTYETNVMGTVNILDAIRSIDSACTVVIVTSDKCYENREWLWSYREDEALGGHDPYSSSKGCAELVTCAFSRSFFPGDQFSRHGVAVASARAGNVIGGGDWSNERLIPDLIRAFACGSPASVRSPHAIRPWQHVISLLEGYLLLAERLIVSGNEFAGAWNFGPLDSDAKAVSWIADRAAKEWGMGASWRHDTSERPHEASLLKLDSSRARMLLRWEPNIDLEHGLCETIRWYKAIASGEDMRHFSEQQISDYLCSRRS